VKKARAAGVRPVVEPLAARPAWRRRFRGSPVTLRHRLSTTLL
jgi:hypothetical protein